METLVSHHACGARLDDEAVKYIRKGMAGAITPPSLGMTVFSFRSGWLWPNKDFMFGYYRDTLSSTLRA